MPGSEAAPEALKRHAERARQRCRLVEIDRLLRRHPLEQGLVGPRIADGVVLEIDQALEVDLLHADVGGDAHECRQLGNRLLEAGEPGRDARALVALAHLQLAEAAHIAQDTVEEIGAADGEEGFRIGGVERHPQLIEAGVDQRTAVPVVEHGAVGIEQNVGAAILQVAHHLRQVLHQHRLADAMHHRAFEMRDLVDDRGEQRPAHVGRRLELGIGARTGRAQEIAAVGGLEIDADRQPLRLLAAPVHRHSRNSAAGRPPVPRLPRS